jgi:hypothetical protein
LRAAAALSVIVMLPALLPVAVVVNVTGIWQLPPAARDVLQVFVFPKLLDAAIAVMLSALVPVLVKVTIWGVLVVPTVCEAKVNKFGLKSAIGPSPAPAKLAVCGLPGAVSVTAMLAVRDPAAVGVKVTAAVQLPAASGGSQRAFAVVDLSKVGTVRSDNADTSDVHRCVSGIHQHDRNRSTARSDFSPFKRRSSIRRR